MIKSFKLKYGYYDAQEEMEPCYLLDDYIFLCFDKLADYFELSDKPKSIKVTFSDKPTKNSYQLFRENHFTIKVVDSNGGTKYHTVNERVVETLNLFPKCSAWLSIIA